LRLFLIILHVRSTTGDVTVM